MARKFLVHHFEGLNCSENCSGCSGWEDRHDGEIWRVEEVAAPDYINDESQIWEARPPRWDHFPNGKVGDHDEVVFEKNSYDEYWYVYKHNRGYGNKLGIVKIPK